MIFLTSTTNFNIAQSYARCKDNVNTKGPALLFIQRTSCTEFAQTHKILSAQISMSCYYLFDEIKTQEHGVLLAPLSKEYLVKNPCYVKVLFTHLLQKHCFRVEFVTFMGLRAIRK